MFKIKNLMMR